MTLEITPKQQQITDNLQQLLQALPLDVLQAIEAQPDQEDLLEIVLDLGRPPEARFPERVLYLTERLVDASDIDYVTSRVGEFGKDNRAGIERTLHRISAIRNRSGRVVGLTCRIGRAVFGTIDIMRDVVETGKSILMLGKPGVGKTTKCREVARVLSEEFGKRVVIVDTSNEIAGDGDIPHPAIGRARRMQVAEPELQHAVMIEAVENHMPEVIVIDEIGTEQESFAARTIAERGVQLVGTAHGNSLENLLMNPTLSDLVGGIQAVTLSDEEAKRRGTQKTVLERKSPPTFDIVIEIMEQDKMAIHHDVASTVDRMLRGIPPRPEIRERMPDGQIEVVQASEEGGAGEASGRSGGTSAPERSDAGGPRAGGGPTDAWGELSARLDRAKASAAAETRSSPMSVARSDGLTLPRPERERSVAPPASVPAGQRSPSQVIRIYPYGVSRSRLEKSIRDLKVPAAIIKTWDDADAIVALKAHYRREPARLKDAISNNKPTFVVKSNTQVQIEAVVREMFGLTGQADEAQAIQEAEEAIERVIEHGEPVELNPQNAYIRRLQHQLAEQYKLASSSVGTEPRRRVRISKR
jgi:stage III sporulation protein SpoIIIAA